MREIDMGRFLIRVPLAACAIGLCPSVVRAQEGTTTLSVEPTAVASTPVSDSTYKPGDGEKSHWQAEFDAWIWLMGIHGDVGARGLVAKVQSTFVDVLDESDSIFALSGRLELHYKRLGFFVDAFYANIGKDDVSGPPDIGNIDVTMEQGIADFGVMYRVLERRPTGHAVNNLRDFSFDLYAGGRYSNVSLTLDPALVGSREKSESWVDPIVGGKFIIPFAERWSAQLNGDIGGFGAASELTFSATGVLTYDFHIGSLPASVMAGYRAIGWDYQTGSDTNQFAWDVIAHGLIFGFGIRF
jgi:hypothetical protein